MTQNQLILYFQTRNGVTSPPGPDWISMIVAGEAAAERPFAAAYRELMCAVGAIDLGAMEFADPNPEITVGYYPKLVQLCDAWGMPSDAMPIALDNGELFVGFPDGHVAVATPAGLTGEKWPDFARFLGEFVEAE